MTMLLPAQRLIVAVDPHPVGDRGVEWAREQVFVLTKMFAGMGVCIKLESTLRACGYGLIGNVHALGVRDVFADLKLSGLGSTLEIDARLLQAARPQFTTIMYSPDVVAMKAFKAGLPDTKVLCVICPTSWTNKDAWRLYDCSVEEAYCRFIPYVIEAGLDGVICGAAEARLVRGLIGKDRIVITPGIRLPGESVQGDIQNPERVATPFNAIIAGADRIIVGKPITQASDPRAAIEYIIQEIAAAMTARAQCE